MKKNNSLKRIAKKTLLKNNISSPPSYDDLVRIIESKQFTVIAYKKHNNHQALCELIDKLQIKNEIENNDSFLYIRDNLRFVFINSGLSMEDKCLLLSHELGHILDPGLKNSDIVYSKIKKEEFANEFSFYLKNPGLLFKIHSFLKRKRTFCVIVLALILCFTGICAWASFLSDEDAPVSTNAETVFFVTSAGKKYHLKTCPVVKYRTNLTEYTLDDAKKKGFNPCNFCIGQ